MKKRFLILSLLGLAMALVYFLKYSPSSTEATSQSRLKPSEAVKVASIPAAPVAIPVASSSREEAVKVAQNQAEQKPFGEKVSAEKTVVHKVEDFKWGQMDNSVVGESLHLGEDTTPTTVQTGFKLFGLFHSAEEQVGAPFDTITLNYDATVTKESALVLSYHTQSADGAWSIWQEVAAAELGHTLYLNAPAVAWQYRLMFGANATADGPQVHSVTVSTHSTAPMAVAAEGSSATVPAPALP